MHYRKMSKNYIFRKFECGLSKEETAKLCFKTVRTVTGWDSGNEIPPECKRLMRMASKSELSTSVEWENFEMIKGKLRLPTGHLVSPQQILAGIALLEINSELELATSSKILKFARVLSKLKKS